MIDRGGWESAAWIRRRTQVLAVLLCLGFAAVLGRAIYLQVVQKDHLASLARDQYLRTIELAPRRGEIIDRSGGTLASSLEVESIYVDPEALGDDEVSRRTALEKLALAAKLSPAHTKKVMDRALHGDTRFTWVRRRASPAIAEQVKALKMEGVGFVKEPRRFYPQRELAAQVLGLVGSDGEGLEGVEKALDPALRGRAETVQGVRDARGRALYENVVGGAEERTGDTVELTIDTTLQYLAEKSLAATVQETRAASGTAVVLDPRSGEVLALAMVPTLNPNVVPGPAEKTALRDRAVSDAFEPGSVLKVMLMAGGLDAGTVRKDMVIDAENGAWRVGKHTVHDHSRHHLLTPPDILRVSSNIGAGKIGQAMGGEKLFAIYRAFGLGERTGIELPGETPGILVPMKSDISTITAAYGQGPVTVSALQIAAAYGAIANGGKLMRPYIVRKVSEPDGTIVQKGEPRLVRQAVSPRAAREVLEWMESVPTKEGTAEKAAIDGYPVAGKTGTAQKPDPHGGGYGSGRIASFAGIVPADDPRLVVLVVIDEPQTEVYGGLVAAPVFRAIASSALKVLGIPPSTKVARVEPAPARPPPAPAPEPPRPVEVTDHGVRVPDLRGLFARAAVRSLASAELEADLAGSGRVVGQRPPAGAVVERGSRVSIRLEPL